MSQHDIGAAGGSVAPRASHAVGWWLPLLAIGSAVALFAVAIESYQKLIPSWLELPFIVLGVVSLTLIAGWDHLGEFVPLRLGAQSVAYDRDELRHALCDQCTVINQVQLGGVSIDQLVISPSGLFALEVDAHARRVCATDRELNVDGKPQDELIGVARDRAMAVRDYLRSVPGGRAVFVTPVLAFTSARVESEGRCCGVYVMPAEHLAEFIAGDKPRLDEAGRQWALDALSAAAG